MSEEKIIQIVGEADCATYSVAHYRLDTISDLVSNCIDLQTASCA